MVEHSDKTPEDQLQEELPLLVEENTISTLEEPIQQAQENLCEPEISQPLEESILLEPQHDSQEDQPILVKVKAIQNLNESVYLIVPELPQSLNDSIPLRPNVIQIEEAQLI